MDSSFWVHIAEMRFYALGSCPDDIIITTPTPAPATGAPATDSGGDNTEPGSTTDSTMPSNATPPDTTTATGSSSAGAIAVGVVIAILAIIAITAIIIIILVICLKRPKGKEAFTKFRNSVKRGLGTGTLEKTRDVEMDKKNDNNAQPKKPARSEVASRVSTKNDSSGGGTGSNDKSIGGAIYEDADQVNESKERARTATGMSIGYEDLDIIDPPAAVVEPPKPPRNRNSQKNQASAKQDDPYDQLGGTGRRKAPSKPEPFADKTQEPYSQLEHSGRQNGGRLPSASKAVNPMYSSVQPQPQQQVYAVVDKPKPKRPKPPSQPQPIEEYAVIDKRSPKVPEKSHDLIQELEAGEGAAKQGGVGDDVYSEPNFPATSSSQANRSAISSDCLGENPLYSSAENQFSQDVVYAEPGPAPVPLPNQSGNIYEQIYEIKSLAPSAFMKEPSPDETPDQSQEALYMCSPIYTVPAVVTDEKPLEVTKENIQEEKILGSGNFGDVKLAKTVNLSGKDLKMSGSTDTNVQVLVAVKMLKPDANISDRNLFEKEYMFMSRLNDPNVIRLLGVCKRDTPFIMMEYMENGDLNQYLKRYKTIIHSDSPEGNSLESKQITTTILTSMCTQIASAMKYLASKNFVHRDLATRNCLVGTNYQVKIADFGMSRNMYESHYYVIKGHAILPIRWMASECFYGQFSAKTDVWAFGVTMWEIFGLAEHEPYSEMEDRDLVKDAVKGADRKLLPRPEACPEEVYPIMRLCWAHETSKRATFENLHQALSSL